MYLFAYISIIDTYSAVTNESLIFWIAVISIFGLMVFMAFELGVCITQGVFRMKKGGCLQSYEKWGVTADLFRQVSLKRYVISTILTLLGTALFALIALLSTSLVIEESLPGTNQISYTLVIAGYGALLGILVESERLRRITDMTRKLDKLRRVFHLRFRPTELLSIYESLRSAPPLFWEEYSRLPVDQINAETNNQYRQSAATYSNNQFGKYHRIMIVVTILLLLLTPASAAIQFFT